MSQIESEVRFRSAKLPSTSFVLSKGQRGETKVTIYSQHKFQCICLDCAKFNLKYV